MFRSNVVPLRGAPTMKIGASISTIPKPGLMNRVTRFQREGRDLDIELLSAHAHHLISSAHGAHGGLERAPRGVLERFAWRQNGLLAHHARAFDFAHVLSGVRDDPVPADQLN